VRTRSPHGGRHELGQNFLVHRPTIDRIVDLVAATDGPILEIGAGDGALTTGLARLGRDLTALDIDDGRVAGLRRRLPDVRVEQGDVLRHPLAQAVIVGNVPFHLTTPILRRLLGRAHWQTAILLTQWEVARKRAGVGGATMMTAQAAPWFEFELHTRVPARGFRPMPSVDGGLLSITRRGSPLLPAADRRAYERFVSEVFTRRGRGIAAIVHGINRMPQRDIAAKLRTIGVDAHALPRDLGPVEWAKLWRAVGGAR
jgi:23S rRNA (adenine-N6)-dimethyltransferase